MPRTYKPAPGGKHYKTYHEDVIKQAVQELLLGKDSIKTVAEKYNMHKSVLYRHSKGILKSQGGQTALSLETEEYIIQYINVCAEWGYPLDALELRYIIKMYLDKLGILHKRFKDNLPGPDYVQSFLHRHKEKISQRICQNIKRSRADVSTEIITKYFEELKKSLVEIPAANIVSYDEKNLSDDPGLTNMITKRGTKYPEGNMNHSNSSVSIMIAGSAEGELLPPYVVYKSQNLHNAWVSHGPKGARYNCSASGWFDGSIFENWIQTIIIPFFADKPGKKLLIGDNLSSHLSIDMIKLCKEHEISFIFLPTNSTHLTQPLDVAFFRPMKVAWQQILLKWKETDGSNEMCVPKDCFPKLLNKLMEEIQNNANFNLKAGFKKTGISPLDPTQVLSQIPTQLTNTNRYRKAVNKSVLNLLHDMQNGTMGLKVTKKKRKLNLVAGKSVDKSTQEDLNVVSGSSASKLHKSVKDALEKGNLLSQETTSIIKSIKRKKMGKMTIRKENDSPSKLDNVENISSSFEQFKDIKDNSTDNNEDIDINVLSMPVYFEDELECGGELTVETSQFDEDMILSPNNIN